MLGPLYGEDWVSTEMRRWDEVRESAAQARLLRACRGHAGERKGQSLIERTYYSLTGRHLPRKTAGPASVGEWTVVETLVEGENIIVMRRFRGTGAQTASHVGRQPEREGTLPPCA